VEPARHRSQRHQPDLRRQQAHRRHAQRRWLLGSARYNQREARNDDFTLHLAWNASDNLTFEGDVQYSKASTKIIDLTMGPSAGPNFENAGPYDLQLHGSSVPTIVIPPNDILTNPETVYHNFAMDHHEDNDADAWAYRADAEYTFDNGDWLDKVRFGVRYEDYNSTTRETGYRWGSISQNWAGGPAVFADQDVPYVTQSYSNWFHKGNVPSGFLFPNTSFFRNYQNWSNTVVDVSTAPGVNNGCCTWVPWDGDFSTKFPGERRPGHQSAEPDHDRRICAAVVQAWRLGRQHRRALRQDRGFRRRPARVLARHAVQPGAGR
jgi:hypothetical protein